MGYSKYELITKKHVVLPKKKLSCITPLPPYNDHLSTMATFFCPQGGHCGEMQLYAVFL